MEIINQYEQMEKDLEMFEDAKRKTTCGCRVQLKNGGTGKATIVYETYGCEKHCTHTGINTMAREWRCACGASG